MPRYNEYPRKIVSVCIEDPLDAKAARLEREALAAYKEVGFHALTEDQQEIVSRLLD